MNIYKVSRTDHVDYDEYDSFVCIAKDEVEARLMHPYGEEYEWKDSNGWVRMCDVRMEYVKVPGWHGWVSPEKVVVEKIGETELSKRVVLTSFNAG